MSKSSEKRERRVAREVKAPQRDRAALLAGIALFALVLGVFLPGLSNGFVGI